MTRIIMFIISLGSMSLYASNTAEVLKRMESLRAGAKMTVIENPAYKKANRLEIAPYYGFSTNDPYVDTTFTGLALTYHHSEFLAAELAYFSGSAEFTDLARYLHFKHQDKEDVSSMLESFYNVNILITPVYSKLSVFSNILFHYDMYFTAGVGQTKTDWDQKFTYNYGAGLRLFFLKRLSFNALVRDYIHKEQRQSMVISKHNFFAMFGVSVFLF